MKIIGLTGSIGMGKSVTATLLLNLGLPVHDSDACVHALLMAGGGGYEHVVAGFDDICDARGNIDRQKLGRIVFNNPAQKKKLEDILHPLVRQSQMMFIENARTHGHRAVVLDIPLLYETGAEKRCDHVIVVTAPYSIQHARVLKRANMTAEKFKAILNSQISDAEKRKRADFVVQTWLGRGFTAWQLKKVLKKIGIRST